MGLEDTIKNFIDARVNAIIDARIANNPKPKNPPAMDEETRKQIAQYQIISQKPYLTKKEMALYLGCSERSVEEWASRPENPLPVGYAGSDMRGKRENLDKWVEREGQRRRLKLAS